MLWVADPDMLVFGLVQNMAGAINSLGASGASQGIKPVVRCSPCIPHESTQAATASGFNYEYTSMEAWVLLRLCNLIFMDKPSRQLWALYTDLVLC